MVWVPSYGPHEDDADATTDNRRKGGRLQPYWLRCNLGHVLDVSGTGARLFSPHALEGEVELLLTDGKERVTLRAEVVWSRRIKRKEFEIGLHFVDPTTEQAAVLARVASHLRD